MSRVIEMVGKRFGRLTVVSQAPILSWKNRRWHCVCDCGNRIAVAGGDLRNGRSQSCGCLRQERITTHGMSRTPIYKAWAGMLSRCNNPGSTYYHYYGGRGITVCERWQTFENFHADMGDRPKGLSLDRIDNDKGYSPENCRWATSRQQCQNRSNNVELTLNGKTQCVSEWSRELGIGTQTLYERIWRGWSDEDTLTLPPRPSRWSKTAA